MTDEFSQCVLLKVVAQICQMVGFHRIMTSPLHILEDILRRFIRNLGQLTQHYAEHCGRTCLNLSDLSLAFIDSGIRPSDLVEFLENVSPLPQSMIIPKYPVSKNILSSNPFTSNVVSSPCDVTQSLQANECSNKEHREGIKIKISLSKIKAASKSKRNKPVKNKKKKKKKA